MNKKHWLLIIPVVFCLLFPCMKAPVAGKRHSCKPRYHAFLERPERTSEESLKWANVLVACCPAGILGGAPRTPSFSFIRETGSPDSPPIPLETARAPPVDWLSTDCK